ncbi:ABC transporter substrate-binding protein [Paeniroseomonas aquatica]|jgi:branched-chain amino acid transport system substrate-binding protein|uniref:ABC transporter substrate-binding protein n=1 Tax=Paeniroseomonas aquatica TaxID=373043 RepID=A0ABT8A0Q7_9PROT|nr:ABC transporter substrate-binding protein [Paeniroseomonas aquatica]MDN3563318.1 ABC transporter substrate-binding protein [Paeniroseomonas aquatica]
MTLSRRAAVGAGLASAAVYAGPLSAQPRSPEQTLRVGLLHDMSGAYRDISGPTSVACARQAIREFQANNADVGVDLLVADHQNKSDVGLAIARQWFDRDNVDLVLGVSNSALAIALKPVVEQKDKVHINSSAATSALTSEYCSPNSIHWSYDTYCLSHATGEPLVKQGYDSWFFITPNYAFGHMLQADTTHSVETSGGRVVGAVTYPFPETTDFSAFLLQAQASGAKVVAFLGAGTDFVNAVKQAAEFGLMRGKLRFVGLTGYINSVMSLGLAAAQGLTQTETFYWDLNDRTRAFMARLRPELPPNTFPCHNQAGDYSGLLHYLKAAKAIGVPRARSSGRAVVATMKDMPTDDDAFGTGTIRRDGRKLHPTYLFTVKSPAESRAPGDVYKVLAVTSAERSFRSIEDGKCSMAKS